jgi:cell filamentation protein
MRRIFTWLRQQRFLRGLGRRDFSRAAAHFLAELNAVHPFREGNGRSQLTFIALLADRAGHPLDLNRLDAEAMLDAMIRSFAGDEAPLATAIEALVP